MFVGMAKVGISMTFNGIEMLNKWKGKGWVPLDGWAKGMTSDMSIYDDAVRTAVRQQLARSGPIGNPFLTLGFMLVGSIIFHILVAKMNHSQNGSSMFVQMMKSGGVMGAMGNMANTMGGGGGGGAPQPQPQPSGMPQAVPNMSNPFPNQNVPPLYTQPPPQQAPPPQPHRAPPPQPQPERAQKKRKPMRRPAFMQSTPPAHPPQSRSQPVPVSQSNDMGSESTFNLDE
jgi:hypothetical protein